MSSRLQNLAHVHNKHVPVDECPMSNIKVNTHQGKGSIKLHSRGKIEVDVKMGINFKENSNKM